MAPEGYHYFLKFVKSSVSTNRIIFEIREFLFATYSFGYIFWKIREFADIRGKFVDFYRGIRIENSVPTNRIIFVIREYIRSVTGGFTLTSRR